MTVKQLYPDDLKVASKFIDWLNRQHDGEKHPNSPIWRCSSRIAIENPEHGMQIGWAVPEDTFWVFEALEREVKR